jgi:hypothetical protein
MTPQERSVVEAAVTGKHPERLTPMILPAPFDAAAFARDPDSYLSKAEPGRVFQPAQPGPDVPVIERIGDEERSVTQTTTVDLVVQVHPGMPVTFNSFDLGRFAQSRLPVVTVRADDEGLAKATFAWAPGTVGRCRILAASPLCSGQINFTVNVR